MDEDGMLLNFVTTNDDSAQSSSKKITGGRWKDRRKLRMALNNKSSSGTKRQNHTSAESHVGHTSAKRSKGNDKRNQFSHTGEDKNQDNHHELQHKSKLASQANVAPDDQIVSSLFTSNREITTSINTNAKDENAVINPSNAPLSGDLFESLGINGRLVEHLEGKMRITKPTSIQKLVIPHLVSKQKDNDLFIHAQTGSGKTLAFLLPMISNILGMNAHIDRKSGCFGLVIAPTRELASQIYQVALMLTQCCHYLVPCLLIGGESKKSEKARLRKGCNFIIGTPGRILDHLQNTKSTREQLSSSLRYVILDEGDKLMELGFEETLTQILQILHEVPVNNKKFPGLPSRIIHVLCSATTTGVVTKLGNVALKNYKLLSNIGKNENKKSADLVAVPDQLEQSIAVVPPKLRLVTLGATLSNIANKHHEENEKVPTTTRTMVFLSCSDSVDFHYEAFSSSDGFFKNLVTDCVRELSKGSTILPCFNDSERPNTIVYKLHGSLSQQSRTATLKHFATNNDATNGKHLIMFCTDVASRGLDLPHVGTVIEYDPPFSVEDHLHRIGRTARAGRSGKSLLFLLPGEEEGYMDHIKKYHPLGWKLLKFDTDILKPAFSSIQVVRNDKKEKINKKAENLEWDSNATTWHLNIERRVMEDQTFKNVAVKAFTSHIRAYATHISSEKPFFNIKCLHLGHLAKSFALRERPKGMGVQNKKNSESDADQKKPTKESFKNKMWRVARATVRESASEFNY